MQHDHNHGHDHHEMPSEGRALTGVAISATLHCLTGCAIGEVSGMAIGTALGWSDLGTIALAISLAFLFGYALTSIPLLRAGLALSAVIPIALASDTISIGVMEVTDNAIMLAVPGAMESGLDSLLFWGALSFALALAFVVTVPVNRWLIARGKGHTAVHETGIHGGPPTRVVGAATALAFVFGSAVLVAEAVGEDEPEHGDHAAEVAQAPQHDQHEEDEMNLTQLDNEAHGTALADGGLRLELARTELAADRPQAFEFVIADAEGSPLREFDVQHDKRMHLIVARRDLTGFQHVHPEMREDGSWTVPLRISEAGSYRAFADFSHGGESLTLGADFNVDGEVDWRELPDPESTASTEGGYEVGLAAGDSTAGEHSSLAFSVERDGERVEVEPYLGADGHLVALREGDLAFLHVHPVDGGQAQIEFEASFPTEGRYRLYLQFQHEGRVQTAEFTREVGR